MQKDANTATLIIQILTDNAQSWIIPYADRLSEILSERGHQCDRIYQAKEVKKGDILVLLGCEKIIKDAILKKNRHNLVVHESALPEGKGWSPLTWQILEGKNEIPITLFEAVQNVDAGQIYLQRKMIFKGWELVDDLRKKQGDTTIELVLEFVEKYPAVTGHPQQGEETFYRKRRPADSKLDINKSIREQFNLLRVVDNERYPAYFVYQGRKYLLKIEYADDE